MKITDAILVAVIGFAGRNRRDSTLPGHVHHRVALQRQACVRPARCGKRRRHAVGKPGGGAAGEERRVGERALYPVRPPDLHALRPGDDGEDAGRARVRVALPFLPGHDDAGRGATSGEKALPFRRGARGEGGLQHVCRCERVQGHARIFPVSLDRRRRGRQTTREREERVFFARIPRMRSSAPPEPLGPQKGWRRLPLWCD